ncbi:MAG: polysaccharide biosynthesis tyrosine autokinase [Actinomycetia bacterium]|nr:polysaccharide biosynthesis tyrosine autokinase [Actinomycetes bacterium]
MPKETTRGELELRDYLAALRRRWPWLIIPLILFPVLAAVFTAAQSPKYEATARVLLDTTMAQDTLGLDANTELRSRDLLNEINLANGDDTTSLVRERLGLAPNAKLPEGNIESELEADVLSFTFTGPTAESAALAANTWATAYVELKQTDAESSITQAVEQLQTQLQLLRDQRTEIRSDLEILEDNLARADETRIATLRLQVDREASSISGDLNLVDSQIAANIESITQLQLAGDLASVSTARLVQNAAIPLEPTNASLSRNLAIGFLVGALVGIGLSLLVDNLDHSINDAEDIQRMGLTLLGVIPEAPRKQVRRGLATVAQTQPGTTLADGYQKIRTALQFTTLGKGTKTILVTSPQQGDGKTTTATNLALALANVESRVVLADIDFRRPQIHTIFNTELIPGISDVLVGQTSLRQVAVNHPELSTTLVAMPAGTQPPNPATFLVSSRFAGLLSDLRNQADLTILDAPPVLPVADALSIASQVDGVILVVKAGTTTHVELTSAVEGIIRSGGQLLGVVVNHARAKATTYGDVTGYPASAQHAHIVSQYARHNDPLRQNQGPSELGSQGGSGSIPTGGMGDPLATVAGPTTHRQSTSSSATGAIGSNPVPKETPSASDGVVKVPAFGENPTSTKPVVDLTKDMAAPRNGTGNNQGNTTGPDAANGTGGNGHNPSSFNPAVTGTFDEANPTIGAPNLPMPADPAELANWAPPNSEDTIAVDGDSLATWPTPDSKPPVDGKSEPDPSP